IEALAATMVRPRSDGTLATRAVEQGLAVCPERHRRPAGRDAGLVVGGPDRGGARGAIVVRVVAQPPLDERLARPALLALADGVALRGLRPEIPETRAAAAGRRHHTLCHGIPSLSSDWGRYRLTWGNRTRSTTCLRPPNGRRRRGPA